MFSVSLLDPDFVLDQLCPTKMAYWAKTYVTISTRAAD